MKRLAFLPLLFALATICTSFTLPSPSLTGQWKGEDNGEVGIISFEKEGYVSFTINNEKVGGKGYQAEGVVFDMFYETDESVTPHHMDFVIKMVEGGVEIARMLGIYQFADDNTLIINMKFDGSPRPTTWDENSDDQIQLTRMTEESTGKKKKKSKKKS
jgi:hypothetical protein